MKAATYVKKIKEANGCSILLAENLTHALHRENRLIKELAIRFRPLYGDFDIVNADFATAGIKSSESITLEELEKIATIK